MPSVRLTLAKVLFEIFHDFKETIAVWLYRVHRDTLLGILLDTECTYLDPIGPQGKSRLRQPSIESDEGGSVSLGTS